jgi:hypothetical protein
VNGAESLLSYLDAPIVVGDPEGRAVYVNPAFEERFPRGDDSAIGLPLAELFDGGAREAVLRGVMTACETRTTARFRLRAGATGYSAVASPIDSGGQAVGVVILFKEELGEAERLLQLQRDFQSGLDELGGTLDDLAAHASAARDAQRRALLEDGLRAIARLRKCSEEMQAAIAGKPKIAHVDRIDVAALLTRIVERAERLAASDGVAITLLAPGKLPELRGDEAQLAGALQRMLDARLAAQPAPERVTVGARVAGSDAGRALMISFSELRSAGYDAPFTDPTVLDEALGCFGATRLGIAPGRLGRSTVLRFPLG